MKNKEINEEEKADWYSCSWYNGKEIIGDFSLSDFNHLDKDDIEDFKRIVLKIMNLEYRDAIDEVLFKNGLELVDLYFYVNKDHPENRVDLKICLYDREKVKKYIRDHKKEFKKHKEIIRKIDKKGVVDNAVLEYMFRDFRKNVFTNEHRISLFECAFLKLICSG